MKTIYNYDGIIVKYEPEKGHNPYRVYRKYNGHTRKLIEYADIISALCFIQDMYREAIDTLTFEEQKAYAEGRLVKTQFFGVTKKQIEDKLAQTLSKTKQD